MSRGLLVVLIAGVLACAGCGASVSKLQDSGDVAGLVAIARDASADPTKRADAFDALGELGNTDADAVDALLGMLTVSDTAADAARALGTAGDPRAVEPLVAYLESLEPGTWSTDTLQKLDLATAARALGGIQDPLALKTLLKHLDAGHAEMISVLALGDALAGQGEAAVPELKKRLAKTDANVYAPASLALGSVLSDDPSQFSAMLKSPKTFRIYVGVLSEAAGVPDSTMIAALNKYGDLVMANAMLADGSDEAKAAAKKWGTEKGYTVREVQPWEQDGP